MGIGQPPGFPFALNSAVDKLLKKEFDIHRSHRTTHPLMEAYGLDAVPFEHEKMDEGGICSGEELPISTSRQIY